MEVGAEIKLWDIAVKDLSFELTETCALELLVAALQTVSSQILHPCLPHLHQNHDVANEAALEQRSRVVYVEYPNIGA